MFVLLLELLLHCWLLIVCFVNQVHVYYTPLCGTMYFTCMGIIKTHFTPLQLCNCASCSILQTVKCCAILVTAAIQICIFHCNCILCSVIYIYLMLIHISLPYSLSPSPFPARLQLHYTLCDLGCIDWCATTATVVKLWRERLVGSESNDDYLGS